MNNEEAIIAELDALIQQASLSEDETLQQKYPDLQDAFDNCILIQKLFDISNAEVIDTMYKGFISGEVNEVDEVYSHAALRAAWDDYYLLLAKYKKL